MSNDLNTLDKRLIRNNIFVYAVLILLTGCFFYVGLGGYYLTAPDEPRFALVAKEMLTENHWVLPHRNSIPYPDKPPLFFWTIAAFSALAGGEVNAWTARLPSAVAATIILLFMWRFSRKEENENLLPILTVLVLMTSALFFFQARIAQIDMVLCVFTTAASIIGYKAVSGSRYSAFWMGMAMGAGILTKGPVGYLIPAGTVVLFAAFKGRIGWKRYPLKALAWGLVPAVIWLVLLIIDVTAHNQWDYLKNLLFKQTVVRYVDAWHHHQPVYYFFVTFLHDFLPWTPFFFIAIPFTRKSRQSLDDRQLFSWAVVVFTVIFFSISSGKRGIYILPIFPFAAYLTAVRLLRMIRSEHHTRWPIGAGVVTGFLLLAVGLALCVAGGGWVKNPVEWIDTPLPLSRLFAAGLVVTPLAVGVMFFSFKRRFLNMTLAVVLSMLVLNLLFFQVMLPWVDPFRSSKGFMETVNRIIHHHDDDPVVGMVRYRSAYRLYGDFPLVEIPPKYETDDSIENIAEFFYHYPDGWIIIREKDLNRFVEKNELAVTVHHMQKLGSGKNMMLITKKGYAGM
ncbi:MAG: glycosyltransferase family 39 protein [Desulfobacterales bacterium]